MSALKQIRKDQKLSLEQLAKRMKTTFQNVWQHEQYGIKTARIAKRYAAALGCDWRELLD